jgi:HSP20 family protein
MLMRFDPFREAERLMQSSWRTTAPLDAYRRGDEFVVRVDLPGVDPAGVELNVEKNVLTLTAERSWKPEEGDEVLVNERPQGRVTRRLFLGEGLDAERITANYENGVLVIAVPVAEAAKPRKVEITVGGSTPAISETTEERVSA